MLTLSEIKLQRRQHLLEFFSWRFGTPNYTAALAYCTGLCPDTIRIFRRKPVSFQSLETLETAALHLGFRPGRVLCKSGRFVKPKSLRLPRWSDAAVRIRFYQWHRQTRGGVLKTERKPSSDIMAQFSQPKPVTKRASEGVSLDPCVTGLCNKVSAAALSPLPPK